MSLAHHPSTPTQTESPPGVIPFEMGIRTLSLDDLYSISAALCEVAVICEQISDLDFVRLADERYDAVTTEMERRPAHRAAVAETARCLRAEKERRR